MSHPDKKHLLNVIPPLTQALTQAVSSTPGWHQSPARPNLTTRASLRITAPPSLSATQSRAEPKTGKLPGGYIQPAGSRRQREAHELTLQAAVEALSWLGAKDEADLSTMRSQSSSWFQLQVSQSPLCRGVWV